MCVGGRRNENRAEIKLFWDKWKQANKKPLSQSLRVDTSTGCRQDTRFMQPDGHFLPARTQSIYPSICSCVHKVLCASFTGMFECIYKHTHTHTHTHIYLYIYIYIERERWAPAPQSPYQLQVQLTKPDSW